MGTIVWKQRCSECGAEGGWAYSHGVLTDHASGDEFGDRGEMWTPLICKDCGSNTASPPTGLAEGFCRPGVRLMQAMGLCRVGPPLYGQCPACGGRLEHPSRIAKTSIRCPKCRKRSYRTSIEYLR